MDNDTVHTRAWRGGALAGQDFPLEQLSDHLDDDCVVWADLLATDEHAITAIAEELDIDPHAIEDAISRHERPKLDRYETHLFLNCYVVELDRETGDLRTCEVSAFITRRALITLRGEEWFAAGRIVERWDAAPELAQYGVAGLLHAIMDLVVDSHFDAVQILDDEIEALEDLLFNAEPRSQEVQRRTFSLRRSLVRLRRLVLPMREVVNTIMRRDHHLLEPALMPYYQDVYDHVLRASEWTESLRDMVTTVFETNLSLQDARLNNVMKKLTSWAAIIAVPTAITSFYGQNVPYPGFGQGWGFWFGSVLMVVLAVLLYAGFTKRGWL